MIFSKQNKFALDKNLRNQTCTPSLPTNLKPLFLPMFHHILTFFSPSFSFPGTTYHINGTGQVSLAETGPKQCKRPPMAAKRARQLPWQEMKISVFGPKNQPISKQEAPKDTSQQELLDYAVIFPFDQVDAYDWWPCRPSWPPWPQNSQWPIGTKVAGILAWLKYLTLGICII